jgi:hypothetical protein
VDGVFLAHPVIKRVGVVAERGEEGVVERRGHEVMNELVMCGSVSYTLGIEHARV